ncbi:hypothetical protein BDZ45DRAFT_451508 [Acephala macrosclerotiorum]|nr:hypothetical protein BDZ45DRAFT_451508 [Acephala macrosclerotiorum]
MTLSFQNKQHLPLRDKLIAIRINHPSSHAKLCAFTRSARNSKPRSFVNSHPHALVLFGNSLTLSTHIRPQSPIRHPTRSLSSSLETQSSQPPAFSIDNPQKSSTPEFAQQQKQPDTTDLTMYLLNTTTNHPTSPLNTVTRDDNTDGLTAGYSAGAKITFFIMGCMLGMIFFIISVRIVDNIRARWFPRLPALGYSIMGVSGSLYGSSRGGPEDGMERLISRL